jgi:hypothetical protein
LLDVAVEDDVEERLLAAEVVVELRLVRPGGRGDAVDAPAGQAVLGELGRRRLEEAFPAGVPVAIRAATASTLSTIRLVVRREP